jgi:hypothetical protein
VRRYLQCKTYWDEVWIRKPIPAEIMEKARVKEGKK